MIKILFYLYYVLIAVGLGIVSTRAAELNEMRGFVREVNPQVLVVQDESRVLQFQLHKGLSKVPKELKTGDYVRVKYQMSAQSVRVEKSPYPTRQLPGQVPWVIPGRLPKNIPGPTQEKFPDGTLDDRAFYPA